MDFTFDFARKTSEHSELKTSADTEQVCLDSMNQGREGEGILQLT